MPSTIEIWEDTGAVVSLHGTTRGQVTNCNWKNSSTLTTAYYMYPLRRPEDDTGWTHSYTKYLYFKISGTFSKIKNLKISLDAVPGLNTQLYGRMSHQYAVPSTGTDGKLILINAAATFYPLVGTTGPETATTFPVELTTGTYYTQYLITQLRVINSTATDVGNTADLKITFTYNEYE